MASRSSIGWNYLVQIQIIFITLVLLSASVIMLPSICSHTYTAVQNWSLTVMCALPPWVMLYKANLRSHWNSNTGMLMPLLCLLYRYFFHLKKKCPEPQNNKKNPKVAPFVSMKFRYFFSHKDKTTANKCLQKPKYVWKFCNCSCHREAVKLPTDIWHSHSLPSNQDFSLVLKQEAVISYFKKAVLWNK